MNLDSARQAFIGEVAELLQSMEDALLTLEDNPDDPESLNEVFRAMHTIKGTGGVFGYNQVVDFTHAVETLMENVRSGRTPLCKALITTLFECRDHTARLIDAIADAPEGEGAIDAELEASGNALLARLGQPVATAPASQSTSHGPKYLPVSSDLWTITLEFHRDALRSGMDPLSFLRYLGSLGDLVHVATLFDTDDSDTQPFDPESCYLYFGIAFRSDADKATIAGVFEFADQDCDVRILEPDSAHRKYLELFASLPDERVGCIGDLLVQVGALTPGELARALATQEREADAAELSEDSPAPRRRLGEILVEQGSIKPGVVEQAAKTQDAVRMRQQEQTRFIRVDAQRLGYLINLVGELVTSSAAIRVMAERSGIEEMTEVVDGVDYLVSEIRDNALQLRMVPIGESLSRFRRVVRDACEELGKDIDLVITGGETELDKTVVEKMTDPLTHLIRNALDHGIEMPETRIAAGKPPNGSVHINAYHDSGHIVIEIADDGAGLDRSRIRAKAEERGLIAPEDILSEEETLRLIFAPGLSTKAEASNLSGRGVGMDVVRRNIEALRGSVELDSQLGTGTKVTIVLPLTLAIIDGFLVGAGADQFVIPLAQVVECVEIDASAGVRRHDQRYINLRGEVLPFIRLTELFENAGTGSTTKRESLVVVRFGHHKMGLVVDALLGELQTVIKPLGKVFERLRGVAGATILGTGDIALILDVAELASSAQGARHPAGKRPATI